MKLNVFGALSTPAACLNTHLHLSKEGGVICCCYKCYEYCHVNYLFVHENYKISGNVIFFITQVFNHCLFLSFFIYEFSYVASLMIIIPKEI